MAAPKKNAPDETDVYAQLLAQFREHAEIMHYHGAQCVTAKFGEIELTVMYDGDSPESGAVH